jgi:hypothetical protein
VVAEQQQHKAPAGPKVSPVRTILSLVLLVVVGAVCGIELRAGLGQLLSGKALSALGEDGAFTKPVPLDEAKAMIKLFPKESTTKDDENEQIIKYEWYSLLRPLMGQTNPELYLVVRKGDSPVATSYHTSAEDEVAPSSGPQDTTVPPDIINEMPGMGGPGGPGGGPPSPMGGAPGRRGGGRGAPGGRGERPPLEDDPAADAAKGDDTKAADAPATDAPAADPPATEAPATEAPAAEAPATEAPAETTPPADAPATGETPAAGDTPPAGESPAPPAP